MYKLPILDIGDPTFNGKSDNNAYLYKYKPPNWQWWVLSPIFHGEIMGVVVSTIQNASIRHYI